MNTPVSGDQAGADALGTVGDDGDLLLRHDWPPFQERPQLAWLTWSP
jgi:hypothetical protein